jgi:hypothetical protein
MRKKLTSAPYFILICLLFSCSELILPKNVEISGTLDLPFDIRVINLNTLLQDSIEKSFSSNNRNETKNLKVYQVDYAGQTVETFCVYIPIEMTEDLNPDHFLATISQQINDGLSPEPKDISMPLPLPPVIPGDDYFFDLGMANNIADINPIMLNEVARYVISIDFDKCYGSLDLGIGLNFHFESILPGIVMRVECAQLSIDETRPLTQGDNIFGNNKALTGNDTFAMQGPGGVTKLDFNVTLTSNNYPGNTSRLRINPSDIPPGVDTVYDGKIIFFHNWTKATIDMHEAIKGDEGLKGVFPQDLKEGFDLSEMGGYFDGFVFEGLEARLFMSGSPIGGMEPELTLNVKYNTDEGGELYYGPFPMDSTPLVLDEKYISNGFYNRKHLPGITDDMPELILNKGTMTDIFTAMPKNLYFTYEIGFEDTLDIYPHEISDNPGGMEGSKITSVLMIMLPMHLKAAQDDSTVSFPDLFGDMEDLFDRNEPDDLISSMDVQTFLITIEFFEPMFFGGCLFFDGDKETNPLLFYPNGIKLDKNKIIVDFNQTQMEIMRRQLIKPNMWMKFKEGEGIIIPKKLGVINIYLTMKGKFKPGDILE